jgi:hypothetical protein
VALCRHEQRYRAHRFLLTKLGSSVFDEVFFSTDRSDEGNSFLLTLFHGGKDGGRATARLLRKTSVMTIIRCGGPPMLGLAQTEVY